ncbi:MAG TPA: glutamine synthetase family protein [Solirubrobacteraceae bacterium]|nr:glutamine synthetase family protein [Solirubrobacteraceae bacterium]
MNDVELIALVCCDLGGIVRGRSVPADELAANMTQGVGWVPADHALTPLGPLAEPNPFGSTGDLRLLPDPSTRVRLEQQLDPFELLLCDIVETDGEPWEGCPRRFLRASLDALEQELGARLRASFEHEFVLHEEQPAGLPFSLEAQRRVSPFPARVMGALDEAGVEPERFLAEFAGHQFEIPVAPAEGLAAADRSVVLKEVVREVARREGRRASFLPLLGPADTGNGVHIHLNLLDRDGAPMLYDGAAPACLSELAGAFAAGILRQARALCALSAASPVSYQRLAPQHWGAGAVALASRNREALLRVPPLLTLGGADPGTQMRLEYRAADATANPYLALGALVRAGLAGVRDGLPRPPLLEADPGTLKGEEAERFGVGGLPSSLEEALAALDSDELGRGWLGPLLYDAYVTVKQAELREVAKLDLAERMRLYGNAY